MLPRFQLEYLRLLAFHSLSLSSISSFGRVLNAYFAISMAVIHIWILSIFKQYERIDAIFMAATHKFKYYKFQEIACKIVDILVH